MKKSMKKFMIACAAVSTVAVAAGMSAMAADISDKYSAENNSIVLSVPADADEGTQATVLVVPTDKKAAVTDADILYINQGAVEASAMEGTVLLKGSSLTDGTYSALVGYYKSGAFQIQEDTFTIGEPAGDTHDVLMGDVVNPAGTINAMDAQQVLKLAVTGSAGFTSDPDKVLAADVITPVGINAMDAQQILRYAVTGSAAGAAKVGQTAVVNASGEIVEYK